MKKWSWRVIAQWLGEGSWKWKVEAADWPPLQHFYFSIPHSHLILSQVESY